MGGGSFDQNDYKSFTAKTSTKTTSQIYTAHQIHDSLNPYGVKFRESRDSVDSPEATPVTIGIDVTGSMGIIADVLARKGVGTTFQGILERKPIKYPHLQFMAIGDVYSDRAPLQVSQFEADNRIVDQLINIWLEGNGGGNGVESYDLPWYFAAFHTEHDSIIKRGKRGYLFTVGDEGAPVGLTRDQINRFIGDTVEADHLEARELLELAQRKFDVFHIIIEEGGHARHALSHVQSSWKDLLGERVISLSDHTKLAETIVSAIEVAEGGDADSSAKGWGTGSKVIHDAIKHLPKGRTPKLLGRGV
jgi:hypothetical protein